MSATFGPSSSPSAAFAQGEKIKEAEEAGAAAPPRAPGPSKSFPCPIAPEAHMSTSRSPDPDPRSSNRDREIVEARVIVTCPGRNFVTLKIVTRSGDKHLMKYMADASRVAATLSGNRA